MKIDFRRSEAMMHYLIEDQKHDRLGLSASCQISLPTYGAADQWVQLTYADLRIAPDGYRIAQFDPDLDAWLIRPEDGAIRLIPQLANIESNTPWSDIVIGVW